MGRGDGHETIRDVEEMERGWEKGDRAVKAEETVRMTEGLWRGRGEEVKRRCSSSRLSQLPGTVRLRGEYEESVSSLVAVTQRRPARKRTGSEAPT